jgi:hypothetical protein
VKVRYSSLSKEVSLIDVSQELILGFGDAFIGLVRHPYLGAEQEGVLGFGKGVGRGIGGFCLHSMAG